MKTIDSWHIKLLLNRRYRMPSSIGVVVDDDYAMPTASWFLGDFAKAMRRNMKKLGVWEYRAESNDCDDFSMFAMSLGRLMHRRSTSEKVSLALGMLSYYEDVPGGGMPDSKHTICFAVVSPDRVVFQDMQAPGREKNLSSTELALCEQYYI